ncbi:MAG: hypothetical protein AB7P07_03550 [Hyphomonadaceae bacterium]
MKLWILAGLFSAATIPWAAAAETTECGLDTRRNTQIEAAPPPVEERDTRKAARSAPQQAANGVAMAQRPQAVRSEAPRRRNGSIRRVPDAVLIDGRGAL